MTRFAVLSLLWSCYLSQASQRKAHKSGTKCEAACFFSCCLQGQGGETRPKPQPFCCWKQDSAAYSVGSPPPCGEGLGWGSRDSAQGGAVEFTASPHPARLRCALAGDPPRKGEGKDRVCRSRLIPFTTRRRNGASGRGPSRS